MATVSWVKRAAGGLLALAVVVAACGGDAQAQLDEQGEGLIAASVASPGAAPACISNNLTCAATGTCQQPQCSVGEGRYAATESVVVDAQNGRRLWQRGFGPRSPYTEAAAYCAALVLDGISGWRVPTNPEMGSIVLRPAGLGASDDFCLPSIDQAAFQSPDPEGTLFFWTASAQGGPRAGIRYLRDFSNGRSPRTFEDDPDVYVRCVHDPL